MEIKKLQYICKQLYTCEDEIYEKIDNLHKYIYEYCIDNEISSKQTIDELCYLLASYVFHICDEDVHLDEIETIYDAIDACYTDIKRINK